MRESVVTDGPPRLKYMSEDDMNTYAGWLKYQAAPPRLTVRGIGHKFL